MRVPTFRLALSVCLLSLVRTGFLDEIASIFREGPSRLFLPQNETTGNTVGNLTGRDISFEILEFSSDLKSINWCGAGGNHLFALTLDKSLYVSADGGKTFKSANEQLSKDR
jgi:hypothetical protein